MERFHKVTAFVTRVAPSTGGAELLVFRHPRAGVQLPAGSVEPDEDPELAAQREVVEETALEGARLVCKLGEHALELPASAAILNRAVNLTGWEWARIPRGLWVAVDTALASAQWSYVRYQEFRGKEAPPDRGFELAGWVPADALSRRVLRHFYHLHFTGESPAEPWEAHGDGHVFRPFWLPLASALDALERTQQDWLAQVHADLARSALEAAASS